MTEADVLDALHARYPAPEWAFLRHVPAATGFNQRRCDALAINAYPSRGCETHGFEVKISKGDLKRELDDPDKAESLTQYCHYWWIVAPHALGVDPATLPTNWGLISVDEATSKVVKKAVKLKPRSPSREFVAALARKVATAVNNPDDVRRAVERAVKEERAKQIERAAETLAGWRKRAERAERALDAFQEGFGSSVSHVYGDALAREEAKRLGVVVRTAAKADPQEVARRVGSVANVLSQALRDVEASIARLRALPPIVQEPSPSALTSVHHDQQSVVQP